MYWIVRRRLRARVARWSRVSGGRYMKSVVIRTVGATRRAAIADDTDRFFDCTWTREAEWVCKSRQYSVNRIRYVDRNTFSKIGSIEVKM